MSKNVLIMFLGMPRCFNITADNIKEKLFKPNASYNFTIVFNIENDLRLGKFKDLKYINTEQEIIANDYLEIINLFKKTYQCEIKDVTFFNIPPNKVGVGHDNNVRRILNVLSNESNTYDFYINLRMDITLSSEIYLDNYVNSFVIVNSSKYRYCSFHNNDWDYMWIGYRDCYKQWVSAYVSMYPLFDKLDVKEIIYSSLTGFTIWNESFEKIYLDQFKEWKSKNNNIECKLVTEQVGIVDLFFLLNNSWIDRPYYILKYLQDLDFKVKLSEHDNIWAVRHFNEHNRNPTYLEQYYEHTDIMINFIEKNSDRDNILQRTYRLGRDMKFLDNLLNKEILNLKFNINIIIDK